MEMEEIQTQGCSKFPRISNGNGRIIDSSAKIAAAAEDEDEGEVKHAAGGGGGGGLSISSSHGVGSLCGWPSSRIVRVSRASGGKDRHSKVLTSKGLRDRRVRLSVNTAIQFYDLQDRLGYDQPSKAVEWLLKAAAPSIAELPSLNPPFSSADAQQLSDDRPSSAAGGGVLDSADVEMGGGGDQNPLSKSCSSTSETSKGSGLSLSRSESRIKARERARERAAEKEKEKENDSSRGVTVSAAAAHHHQNMNPISSSFTELLTGTTSPNPNPSPSPNSSVHQNRANNDSNFFPKSPRQWDYFTNGLSFDKSSGFSGNIHLTNPLFNMAGEQPHHHHHPELQHFSFVSDHLAPVVTAAGSNGNNNEYNLNFSISQSSSSGLAAGYNRGTLQSNSSSPSLLPHFQRFLPPLDGSSPGFFTATSAATNAAASVDNNHFLPAFDARLQLYYGDAHTDHKGKGKN